MQLRKFVSLTSVILCGWLVVTFVTEVPTQRYPKLDKHVRAVGLPAPEQEPQLAATSGETPEIIQVSVSH